MCKLTPKEDLSMNQEPMQSPAAIRKKRKVNFMNLEKYVQWPEMLGKNRQRCADRCRHLHSIQPHIDFSLSPSLLSVTGYRSNCVKAGFFQFKASSLFLPSLFWGCVQIFQNQTCDSYRFVSDLMDVFLWLVFTIRLSSQNLAEGQTLL